MHSRAYRVDLDIPTDRNGLQVIYSFFGIPTLDRVKLTMTMREIIKSPGFADFTRAS